MKVWFFWTNRSFCWSSKIRELNISTALHSYTIFCACMDSFPSFYPILHLKDWNCLLLSLMILVIRDHLLLSPLAHMKSLFTSYHGCTLVSWSMTVIFSICSGRLNRKEEAPSCTNGSWKSRAEEDWESNKPPSYLLQEADGVVQEGKRASHSLWCANRSHNILWKWQDVWVLQPSMEVRETFFPISYHPSFCSFSSLRGSRNFRYGVVIAMVFVLSYNKDHVVEVSYYP